MNGLKARGLTLEFYSEAISERLKYWEKYGDISLFNWSYQNLFDHPPEPASYEYILAQDTLHHIEPCNEAIEIIGNALKDNGKFIVVEENGDNLVLRMMLYRQRGSKRIIKLYDDILKKDILFGNENIRGFKQWRNLFEKAGLRIDDKSLKYIRFYLPKKFLTTGYENTILRENKINNNLLLKYLFYSLNFNATKIKDLD